MSKIFDIEKIQSHFYLTSEKWSHYICDYVKSVIVLSQCQNVYDIETLGLCQSDINCDYFFSFLKKMLTMNIHILGQANQQFIGIYM